MKRLLLVLTFASMAAGSAAAVAADESSGLSASLLAEKMQLDTSEAISHAKQQQEKLLPVKFSLPNAKSVNHDSFKAIHLCEKHGEC